MGEPNLQQNLDVKSGLKQYGLAGLKPFAELLEKYESDLTPYLGQMEQGLRLGAQGLRQQQNEATEQREFVANLFDDGADWFHFLSEKITAKNLDQTLSYIEQEGRKHPTLFFSMAYFTGAIIGRLGRHLPTPQLVGKLKTAATNLKP